MRSIGANDDRSFIGGVINVEMLMHWLAYRSLKIIEADMVKIKWRKL